jgi:hypothetical protein
MFGVEGCERSDVVSVRDEIALRVAQVGAIKPHVALIKKSINHDEAAFTRFGHAELEVFAVQKWSIFRGEEWV